MRRVLGGWALLCLVMLLVQACGYSVADCVPNDHKICREGVIYWVDSCDKEGDKVGDCECGCNADLSGCEDPCECTPECNSKCCGPDGCGATCPDNCPTGYVCNAQSCECESERECETNADCPLYHWCDRTVWECKPVDCTPNCTGKCCGPDGCSGTCPNNCPAGYRCNAQFCGCEPGRECETNQDCPQDHWCDRTVWECKEIECIPNCTGKCGGTDGCDGTCPNNCPTGYECNTTTWTCETTGCITNADCTATQCCVMGVCTHMSCGTFECGPDPVCGKECGPCTPPTTCQAGRCVGGSSGAPGDPCSWGDVNPTAGPCNTGLACLGNDDIGSCPGGTDAECTGVADNWNPDCVSGICGFSFCSEECDAQGNCPAGFTPADVSGTCYCIPA